MGVFTGQLLRGDHGEDLFSGRPVAGIVMADLARTLILAVAGLGWAAVLGIALGCLSAVRPNGWFDRITGVIAVGTIAIPSFLVSIWSLLIFAIWLREARPGPLANTSAGHACSPGRAGSDGHSGPPPARNTRSGLDRAAPSYPWR